MIHRPPAELTEGDSESRAAGGHFESEDVMNGHEKFEELWETARRSVCEIAGLDPDDLGNMLLVAAVGPVAIKPFHEEFQVVTSVRGHQSAINFNSFEDAATDLLSTLDFEGLDGPPYIRRRHSMPWRRIEIPASDSTKNGERGSPAEPSKART